MKKYLHRNTHNNVWPHVWTWWPRQVDTYINHHRDLGGRVSDGREGHLDQGNGTLLQQNRDIQLNNYCWCKYPGARLLYPLALRALLNSATTLEPCLRPTASASPLRRSSPPWISGALAICPHSSLILHYLLLHCMLFLPSGNVFIIYIDKNGPESSESSNYVLFHIHWGKFTPCDCPSHQSVKSVLCLLHRDIGG